MHHIAGWGWFDFFAGTRRSDAPDEDVSRTRTVKFKVLDEDLFCRLHYFTSFLWFIERLKNYTYIMFPFLI